MKKITRVVTGLLLCATIASACVGCKPKPDQSGVSEKLYPIRVHLYKGGFGSEWLNMLSKEYNETVLKDTDYEIVFKETREAPYDSLVPDMIKGNNTYQLFINAENNMFEGIYKDVLMDMTDIVESEIDGKPLKDKINGYEAWQSLYSKHGEGLMALPWDYSICGLIYDHRQFVDKGFYTFATEESDGAELAAQGITFEKQGNRLVFKSSENEVNYSAGDFILTKGQDGKYGTYDDGQPLTEPEFEAMVKRIKSAGVYPFIWGGSEIGADYLNFLWQALFAQYEGEEENLAFYKLDSNGKNIRLYDGTEEVLTVKNGYDNVKMEGVKFAYEFFKKYFDYTGGNAEGWCHPVCQIPSATHLNGQDRFILGYQNSTYNPESAFLCDGIWWENEASAMFKTLEDVGRGKGDREYRFLVLPRFDGQTSDKSWYAACNTGVIFMAKDANAERAKVTKDFVRFILSNKNLSRIAAMTGYVFNYDVELAAEDKENMTPFIRNVYEMYADKDRIAITDTPTNRYLTPLTYSSEYKPYTMPRIDGVMARHCQDAVKKYSVERILESFPIWTKSEWSSFIAHAQQSGFYTDIQ